MYFLGFFFQAKEAAEAEDGSITREVLLGSL